MKIKKAIFIGTTLLLLSQSKVAAYTEKDLTEYSNGIVKTVEANSSEENVILDKFAKDIEINGKLYSIESVERVETDDHSKNEIKQLTEILNTSNEEKIKRHFGEKYQYEDNEYRGSLPISNIAIKTIDQGNYEEIDEQKIDFSGYSQNDLNNIAKEILLNNKTYYLINVDWQVETSETVDNQEVPTTYKGIMIYQTVVTKNIPSKYEVTVTYNGEVERINPIYKYSMLYQPVEVEEVIQQEETTSPVVPIVISGMGIGIIAVGMLLAVGNIKIYNKTDKGYKLIGKFKISEKNKIINLTKYQFKTNTNMYSLKLNQSLYKKMKNQTIYLQVGQIKKQIYINAQYIEILI